MNGFERRRNEKKRIIMQTAMDLFSAHGFDRVSMTEIAEKAHVSKVSIYNFFESKDNLRRVIIKEILDDSLERLTTLFNGPASFIEKIEKYMGSRTDFSGRYGLDFFFDSVENDPELREYFQGFLAVNKRMMTDFIKQGKEIGYFSSDISDTAIEIYIDMYHSYFIYNKTHRDTIERNPELAGEINLLFLDGLIRDKEEGRD